MLLERVDVKIDGGYDIPLPKMMKIEQKFKRERLEDIESAVHKDMKLKLNPEDYKSKRIAVAVGSRGIANLSVVVGSVVKLLKQWGAEPFITPSMGSHGGATAEGQTSILEGYGITEESMGTPIVSSMDVVEVAALENGMSVYLDKNASEADGIVVVNRVKPHTDFKGDYESGILKMLAIGLGKHKGATTLHSYGFDQFHDLIPRAGKAILDHAPIVFGIAILENAYDETAKVEILPKEHILTREKELLVEAKGNMPKFLLSSIDVLIVEQMGKEISGAGMDPNVTGRTSTGLPGFDAPPLQKIVVLELTKKTQGNACGIGLADVTTIRCVNQIDFSYLYANSITSTELGPAKIPVAMNTDKEAIVVALKTCNRITPQTAKIVRIKNTLELHQIEVSEAYLSELQTSNNVSILTNPQPICFSQDGRLI
jgi:hypothetical protein